MEQIRLKIIELTYTYEIYVIDARIVNNNFHMSEQRERERER